MSAQLAVVQDRPALTVIAGGLSPKRGKPSAEDNARLELVVLRQEVGKFQSQSAPLQRALLMAARTRGTAEYRAQAAMAYLIEQLVRKFADEQPDTAA